ncbi:hypothetical protein CWN98_12545 [Vibrio splendidus]|uniref:CapA family protein n=1 Tax=Vibrio splendidus TaxID=29497 RepID=UPI000D3546D2|nr:CapA family protein [Vibrio splendidus]PTO86894.1 hypothetical protein CWN98_12545 [Vibrio splendidus]PTP47533.1 hypothetical protein CWO10_12010 [Vibrio splendidus]
MLSFTGDLYLKEHKNIDVEFIGDLIINLEYPITENDDSPSIGKVNLRAENGYLIESLTKKPYAACLANNHILDFGPIGARSTISYLQENKIKYFGFGTRDDNFLNPLVYTDEHGLTYEVFGYCDEETSPSQEFEVRAAPLDMELITSDLNNSKADVKIVCIHWGDEENPYPSKRMMSLAKIISDLDVSAIIGHHAHVVQPKIKIGSCDIYFNLGNLYFPDLNEPYGWDGEKYSGRYVKVQSERNKKSLVVNVSKNNCFHQLYSFNKGSFKIDSAKLPSICLFHVKNKLYNRFYTISLMTRRFLSKPRIPNLKQLKRFFGGI